MLHSMKINNGKREFVAIKDHIEHAFKKIRRRIMGCGSHQVHYMQHNTNTYPKLAIYLHCVLSNTMENLTEALPNLLL